VSRRTRDLLLALVMGVLSISCFAFAAVYGYQGSYSHATFDLVLAYGLQQQARDLLERTP
jgi:hypothetical protein